MAENTTVTTPTRLKDYPYMIDNTEIPFPKTVTDARETVENVNQSETGKDILQIKRLAKRNLAFTYRLASEWVPIFETFAESTTPLTVKFYDGMGTSGQTGYVEKSMRMRNFQKTLLKDSEDLYGIMGIWDITFNLIEF